MKRLYFVCAYVLMVAVSVYGHSFVMPDLQFQKVSPDGKYAVSDSDEGFVKVVDTSTGGELLMLGSEDGWPYFFRGYGNSMSDAGIFVGQYGNDEYDGAVYVDVNSGDIVKLASIDEWGGDQAMGITPDGSVICGYVTNTDAAVGQEPFKLPVIWRRTADGSYGEYELLPVPNDWTGNVPYMLEAHCISDDGNIIVGRMTDAYSLSMIGEAVGWPVVYSKNDADEWECRFVGEDLINPNNVEIPEYPAEAMAEPLHKNFMTSEEYDAYMDAYIDWLSDLIPTEPQYEDFMTEDELASYNEALLAYQEYLNRLDAFKSAYEAATAGIPMFYYEMCLSPDGRFVGLFDGEMDMEKGINVGKSFIFDIQNDTHKCITTPENFFVTQLAADGSVLGYEEISPLTYEGYILPSGAENMISLYEWVKAGYNEPAEWMEEMMDHTVLVFVDGEYTPVDKIVTGAPYANRDFSIFVSRLTTTWDIDDPYQYISYILDLKGSVGVDMLEVDSRQDKDGLMDIYTIDGRLIKRNASQQYVKSLSSGIYIMHSGNDVRKIMVNNH